MQCVHITDEPCYPAADFGIDVGRVDVQNITFLSVFSPEDCTLSHTSARQTLTQPHPQSYVYFETVSD